jgi:hypothetical protein
MQSLQVNEWVCVVGILLDGGLCYMAGWTSRASWSAAAVVVTIVQICISRGIGCAIAMVVVSVLCAVAGKFDRKR